MAAHTSTSYDLVARNLTLGGARVTDSSENIAVTYALAHNGADYGGGSMAWSARGYENAWSARFSLPPTPGVLKAIVTASATIDGETVIGRLQASIQVIA